MKINSIQVLRGFAVILVTHIHSVHLQTFFSPSKQQSFYHLFDFGAIGVDLFFIISGFIISHVAGKYRGAADGWTFLKKRFLRINPVYYLLSIFYFALLCFLTPEMGSLGSLLTRLINSILILPILGIQHQEFNAVLTVGWSLSFEWLFYMIFFIAILLKVKNKLLWLSVVIVSIVTIGQLYHPNLWIIFYTHPLLLEFLMGVLIHSAYKKVNMPAGLAALLFVSGTIGIFSNIFIDFGKIVKVTDIMQGNGQLYRAIIWGIPCLFLFAGSTYLEKAGKLNTIWNNQILLLIGNASFSIYLCHEIANYLIKTTYLHFGTFLNPDVDIFFRMALGIGAGVFFYKKIEKPLTDSFHSEKPRPVIQNA